jgi:hypothetical protein
MPLINKKQIQINQCKIVPRTNSPRAVMLESFDFFKKPYWYIEVFDCNSFVRKVWEEAIPSNVLKLIQSGSITLLVNNFSEAFTDILDPLYRLLICDFNISEANVILFTGARDIMNTLTKVSTLYNKKEIKIILTAEFEDYVKKAEEKNTMPVVERTYTYSKKFINLNRRWRPHRPAFVSLLIVHNLGEHGYISLVEHSGPTFNFTWATLWDTILNKHPYFNELLQDNKTVITNSTPLVADGLDPNINPDWADLQSNKLYRDSYFSIVSETNFYSSESRFLTEKTFKTITHRHPFLLLSLPGSLEFFREKGYKTFSPFINEEYDKESDDDIRMKMVLDETIRLCNLSESELKTFVDSTGEICDYNYNVLMSKTNFNTPLN